MENNKISFEEFCDPAFRRSEQIKHKSEVVWLAFLEFDGLINKSKFAEKYMERSQGWFSQRLNGNIVRGKEVSFTPEEYNQISKAFEDIASRLKEYSELLSKAGE